MPISGTDIAGLQLLFDLNLRRRPQRSINARSTKGIWFRKLISSYHLTHHAAVVGAEIFSYNCLNVYSFFCTERQPSDLCIHMKNKLTIFLLANDRITSIAYTFCYLKLPQNNIRISRTPNLSLTQEFGVVNENTLLISQTQPKKASFFTYQRSFHHLTVMRLPNH